MLKNDIMKRIKVSENFYLDEFVDPYTYFYTNGGGINLIDHRLFEIAQLLRDKYGKGIRINNWWWYYQKYKLEWPLMKIVRSIEKSSSCSKWSGIRTDRTSIGSSKSAHRLTGKKGNSIEGKGQAIDPKGNQIIFMNIVRENAKEFYSLGLRRLEDISITKGWLHMDTLEYNTEPNSIRVVDLTKCTEVIRWTI